MDGRSLRKFVKIDKKIARINENLNYLSHINPINLKFEKKKFFKSNFKCEPEFEYRKMDLDTKSIKKQLDEINVPSGIFENMIRKKIEFSKKLCGLNESINTFSFLEISRDLFGCPDSKLVEKAHKILKQKLRIKKREDREKISSFELKALMEEHLREYSLNDWKVVLGESYSTYVIGKSKLVSICKDREFDEKNVRRLLIHEIGVHVLRCENGRSQILPFCFGENDVKSLGIEEGLAIYVQVKNDLMPNGSWRSVASSVIAIDSLRKGNSFSKTFNLLLSFGLSEEFSWRKCVRTFRGGGLTKDYLYLKGYLEIKDFARMGGDIKDLYVGRISICDLKWLKPLIDNGVIKKPKYLPKFLEK